LRRAVGTLLGKSVAGAVKLRGRSGGQALPGLVVEKLIPGYLAAMLKQLPEGVVIITGTNGKTTTTKMVVELLRANGKRVLTNPTGSNLTRGIISSVSRQAYSTGRLPFDIAVFELDEAYACRFTDVVKPRYVLGLNASRDQLDRFGEVDKVAQLISETMLSASTGIVTNADDERLRIAVEAAEVPVLYFGVAPRLQSYFPKDEELVAVNTATVSADSADRSRAVELVGFKDTVARYRIADKIYTATLHVTGQHNFQNAAAALALVRTLQPRVEVGMLLEQLSQVKPAFGRGQTFQLRNGSKLQINLVKNPASFRQGLASYVDSRAKIMIAINDRIADGRDMSWLWDVDFTALSTYGVATTTGNRAADIALRLQYDEVSVGTVESDINEALKRVCKLADDKVVFATYTAMLHMHAVLERKAGTEL